ncbi:MAG: hypothetical protein ACOYD0_09810 [Candidatus Nanopelagicales bacterium]
MVTVTMGYVGSIKVGLDQKMQQARRQWDICRVPRLLRSVVSVVLAMGLGLGFAGAANAAPAATTAAKPKTTSGSTDLPYTLGIRGANGQSRVQVTIPQGSAATRLTGTLKANYNLPGKVILTANGRKIAEVNAQTGGAIDAALNPGDVTEGVLPIAMSVKLESDKDCFADDNAVATLTGAKVDFTIPAVAPKNIGAFLSPGLDSYTVVVPADPSKAEQQAGLDAVSALTYRYPAPTVVNFASTNRPTAGDILNRVIRLSETAGATGNSVALDKAGQLVITGGRTGIDDAAIALGDANTNALQSNSATGLTRPAAFAVKSGSMSLAKFGTDPISLVGVGRSEATVAVNQPAFGQSLEKIQLNLRGSMTPVPAGGQGRVDFVWNGTLLASLDMAKESAIDLPLTIDQELLRRNNALSIQMSYTPPGASCSPVGLGARADIDTEQSTVEGIGGDSLAPGFDRFPQTLASGLPFATGTAQMSSAQATAAGALVSSLQSATPTQQLTLNVMDFQSFAQAGAAGVLVGSSLEQAQQLNAEVTVGSTIEIGPEGNRFSFSQDEPLAVLAAYADGDRNLILLSGQGRTADQQAANAALATELAQYANRPPQRWLALPGEALSMGPTKVPTELQISPPTDSSGISPILVGAIALGLLLILLVAWLWWRPKGEAPPVPGTEA